jgi:membrane-bound lytic murein transglycosylase B
MRGTAIVVASLLLLVLAACSTSPEVASDPSARGGRQSASKARAVAAPARLRGNGYGGEKPASGLRGDYGGYRAAVRLVDKLVREEGFDRGYLEGVIARIERQQWILDFVNRPKAKKSARPTGAWTRYRAKFVTPANISNGVAFWRRYESTLARVQAKYGVSPEYVVAILGVETHYGGYTGKHRVIDALATLAFDYPRRSAYFTSELEAFLIMSRDEGFDPFQPRGSYAGAMGLGQFMPSSFHKWAVDFDGDGKRDLWSPVDAIGSVANYFASFGWREGEAVAIRARSGGSGVGMLKTGFDTSYGLDTLGRNGILATTALGAGDQVSLIELDARGGYEYWLGLKNFYVITRYNHSSYYAMAVHQLARALRARHGPGGPVLTQAGARGGEPLL